MRTLPTANARLIGAAAAPQPMTCSGRPEPLATREGEA